MPSVEDPFKGELGQWFDVNMMGGACGYLILLTTDEFVPTNSRFVLTLDHDFDSSEIIYEENNTPYQEGDLVALFIYWRAFFNVF